MKLYSYVITHDSGFAPNPFYGVCTLATCKPVIRRVARERDWIMATGSVAEGRPGDLVYAMKVSEIMSMAAYGKSKRFKRKIPRPDGTPIQQCGDNAYYKNKKGIWHQRKCYHDANNVDRDLRGENVLISNEFYYFGCEAKPLPDRFKGLVKKGPGHRHNFDTNLIQRFIEWLRRDNKEKGSGRYGLPKRFKRGYQEHC